jgi:uncharacterized protein YhhL (DUF1145 family)
MFYVIQSETQHDKSTVIYHAVSLTVLRNILVSIAVFYHAVSLTVLRSTLVSITVIYHAVSLTVLRSTWCLSQ